MKTYRRPYPQVHDWDNLYLAYHQARKGKRRSPGVAAFEFNQEQELITLEQALAQKTYQPGPYHIGFRLVSHIFTSFPCQ